jgi:hypothetical protein
MIQSLSVSAEVTLALHNLNSEGIEGNLQQTRMVHVVDPAGDRHSVNAVSGDMFKHIYVHHLTAILTARGQALSSGAAIGSADRITVDPDFKAAIKGRGATDLQSEMIARCAVTDIAGTLFTEGITWLESRARSLDGWSGSLRRSTLSSIFTSSTSPIDVRLARRLLGAKALSPDGRRSFIGRLILASMLSFVIWNWRGSA